jgi:hypothetical protein
VVVRTCRICNAEFETDDDTADLCSEECELIAHEEELREQFWRGDDEWQT